MAGYTQRMDKPKPKVHRIEDEEKGPLWVFDCPGCHYSHPFDKRWTFNGDVEKPTFSPSLLVYGSPPHTPRCHSFVRNGEIQFLSDSTHALAGKTVPLPDVDW